MVLGIPVAVDAKERITCLAYSPAKGRLHPILLDSPGVHEAAAAVLQRASDDPALSGWLSSDQDTATMDTPEVQEVFEPALRLPWQVSRVTGVRMPSGMDSQYPHGHADSEAPLSQVLMDQQALSWRARVARVPSREAVSHAQAVDPELLADPPW